MVSIITIYTNAAVVMTMAIVVMKKFMQYTALQLKL